MTMGGALLMALLMVVFIMFAMRRVCIVSPSQNDESKLFCLSSRIWSVVRTALTSTVKR